jgi:hypothetical protein
VHRFGFVADEDHVEEAGSMDTFDAGHFDVGCGGGAGDPGDQRRRLRAAAEVFRESFNDLTGAEDAEVPVGQEA